jgi:hypothetical protein
MGTVELLTREGEIEIAKRIEGGLNAMMAAISESPATIAEILVMAEEIREGKVVISTVVDGFPTPTRPTTTWPKKTSTSTTKPTTTTARAAPRP